MSDPVHPTADDDLREAMAAFAHDLRTPLTAVRMVAELARRQSHGHELHLDGELVEMFDASLDDLNALADALQETSRLRRGKLILGRGPAQLSAVVESARARIAAPLLLEGEVPGDVNGPWDIKALSRAIASLAETTNRAGGASGRVSFACSVDGACCILTLQSGQQGMQQAAESGHELGFSFFHARQLVEALGGEVRCTRGYQCATITLTLPWKRGDVEDA